MIARFAGKVEAEVKVEGMQYRPCHCMKSCGLGVAQPVNWRDMPSKS